ncbi:MAG: hypothetical protein ACT4P5_16010 [Armatimonadota bacterium]
MGEKAFSEVAGALGARGEAAKFDQSLRWVMEQPELWLFPPVVACATEFVQSELDWQTEGARGYGRLTEYIPRLAGWLRDGFSRLGAASSHALGAKVADAMLRGYGLSLLLEGVARNQIYRPQNVNKEQLWEKWIPLLYGSPASADVLSPLKHMVGRLVEAETQKFRSALSEAGIRIGFMAGPRLAAVVNGYLESGVLLRQLEVWGKFEDEPQRAAQGRTRGECLAQFLNAYWGVHRTPEVLAAKLKDDLSLERVDADELWIYFAFVAAHTALANDFSQDDINGFLNLAAMERGGPAGYDALFGLIEKRLPQYIEAFSNLALMREAGMEGGVIAAMRGVAENIAGESGAGLRMALAPMTADIAEKVTKFIRDIAAV